MSEVAQDDHKPLNEVRELCARLRMVMGGVTGSRYKINEILGLVNELEFPELGSDDGEMVIQGKMAAANDRD